MKQYHFFKSILLCIMLAAMYSCSKTDEPAENSSTVDSTKIIAGCEIKNPETAIFHGYLKADYIYIYGSRKTKENEPEKLWIAQYSLQHELLKEYTSTVDALSLYAMKMVPIQHGKYLITSNCGNSQDDASITNNVTEQVPVILDPAKKELFITRIGKGYFFDTVIDYDDFLLLTLSDTEINLNPAINPNNYQSIQMNYKGEVLLNTTKMRVPDKKDCIFWINQSEYITANQSDICSTFLDGNKKDKWKQQVNVPAQSTIKIAIVGNDAKVEYSFQEKERMKNKIYNFDLESGQQKTTAEKISTCIDSNEITLVSNKEFDLQASILPINTYLNRLKYETSDATIATVTENGIVKTHKSGSCIIYIYSEDGFAEQEIQLTVSSLSFTKKIYDIAVGHTERLEIIKDESITSNDLIWKSNDENIATVNEQGEVTGLQEGETTITVTSKDGLLKASCILKVKGFMEYINFTCKHSFVGNENFGYLSLKVSVSNQSEDDAEIISLSLCYEEDDQVTKLVENEKLPSKTTIEKAFPQFTFYPIKKPYLKLIIRHQGKEYETKYSLSPIK